MLVDTHCHLNFSAFKDDAQDIIKRTLKKGVWMINVGSQYSTSKRAVEIANQYKEGVYAAIGLHPVHLFEMYVDEVEAPFQSKKEEFDYEKYQELAQDPKTVAIGECGLDYFHLPEDIDKEEAREKQKEVFRKHIRLSNEVDKPLILHCRGDKDDPMDAYIDILAILKESSDKIKGVIHCFAGDQALAKEFLLLGMKVSFTGVVTFKNAQKLQEVVKSLPLETMMVETDAPYISPEPVRGKRNEPLNVIYIAQKIAEIKNVSSAEVEEITNTNVKQLFNLPI